eukprot:TRINITY_DN746_c0_g1_i1.p1 TRINITY_DN746_c0_g1~~TRINITY_DN746_c0_g1_i1.p1  ORF type:complete len:499 (-),score=61.09 TRINITY_DN746_c0_g1_i1:274-1680(-)
MLRLVWKSGRESRLYPGDKLELGRADVGKLGPWAVQVSRVQCIVQCGEGGKVTITGKGKTNPAVVLKAGNTKDVQAIKINEEVEISETENQPKRQKTSNSEQQMLIMVGPPGSGKSTFANHLRCEGGSTWIRVNQDTISNGKQGTRQQCLQYAEKIIKNGHSCVIDRCNVTPDQRKDFVQLAQQHNIEVHAVVLSLTKEVCMERAMCRQHHEGGVEGKEAAKAVAMMLSQLTKQGMPTKEEGFESVQICMTDQQILQTLQQWGAQVPKTCPLSPTPSPTSPPNFTQHWQQPLRDMALYPEKAGDDLLHEDKLCIMIKDKYPKAQFHALVISKENRLNSIYDLEKKDSAILMHLRDVGEHRINNTLKLPVSNFRIGFHSIPSMRQLHLHVVSTDYDSESLKNKKHWNSFASPFFLGFWAVYNQLQRYGKVYVDVENAEKLLKNDLKCYKCNAQFDKLPQLKKHIKTECL